MPPVERFKGTRFAWLVGRQSGGHSRADSFGCALTLELEKAVDTYILPPFGITCFSPLGMSGDQGSKSGAPGSGSFGWKKHERILSFSAYYTLGRPFLPGREAGSDGVMMDTTVEASVVIPCLNEAQSITLCVDKALAGLKAAGIDGEVVVADNGSTDGSQQIALQHGARVVHAALKGYGHALRAGIEAARGQFIIMGDADDSYDFSEAPRFVAKWREGWEVVMGNRFKGVIKPGAMPWHHKYIGNPVLSGLLRVLFHTQIGDSHCGMRGFTKSVYQRLDLRTTGMEFASEFVIKAVKLNVRMTEIPITLWPDKRGRPPHLRSFRDGWRHLRFMLLYAPNWLFLGPGGTLVGVGLALVVWLLPGARWVGQVRFDIHTMFFGVLFTLLGMQIVTIGLFAKIFSYTEQFDHSNLGLSRWLRRVPLEYGLVAGTMVAVMGFCGNVGIFWRWKEGGFGALSEMRWLLFWSMLFFIGTQIIFSSFFMSMLGVGRGTYLGGKEFEQ